MSELYFKCACGHDAELVDCRVGFAVECKHCGAKVYGLRLRFIDDIEDDQVGEYISDLIDWEALREDAIEKWETDVENRKLQAEKAELAKYLVHAHDYLKVSVKGYENGGFASEVSNLLNKLQ